MDKQKKTVIPKLPYGEGSIWLKNDTFIYRKRIGKGKDKKDAFTYGETVKK